MGIYEFKCIQPALPPHAPREWEVQPRLAAPACRSRPAVRTRRAGRLGREAPLTWHTKAPYTSGGRRHSQVRGPRRARQWEIPAAPEPRTYPPRAAFSPPPAAPGTPRWLWLVAGGPQAGEGGSWWRRRRGLAVAPPREGGSPARGGESPTGRGARVRVPGLPAAGSPPARNRFM